MQGQWSPDRLVGPDVWQSCGSLLPAGSVFVFLAEHRAVLFPDEMFADLYSPSDGRISVPPQVLAALVVLQTLYGRSDDEAMAEARFDLRWKAACGLGLYDPGFDPSLLTYFRRRLRTSADPRRLFTAVSAVVAATGVISRRHRRALDSAVLDDAVATQDTVTQLIAAVRRVIRVVPGAAAVGAEHCRGHDYADPGKPKIAWNDAAARAALVSALVTDALNLLGRLPQTELGPEAADAVGLLALVAGQDVEPADDSDGTDGRRRIARRTAPGRIVSTVDPEARHIHKSRSRYQDGYRAHVAIEPVTGIFTDVELTVGDGPANHEAALAPQLPAGDDGVTEVLADCAYGTGGLRQALADRGLTAVIKPPPLKTTIEDGLTLDDFDVDAAAGKATCSAGHTVPLGRANDRGDRDARFGRHCTNCPLRHRCTTAKAGRILTVSAHWDILRAARLQAATDPDWQAEYRQQRPMVERSIAWLVDGGNRRLRYRGTIRNDQWLRHRATALNLRRLINLGLTRTHGTWALTAAA
jgi:DDE family transposase/transposase-like protein DUF772